MRRLRIERNSAYNNKLIMKISYAVCFLFIVAFRPLSKVMEPLTSNGSHMLKKTTVGTGLQKL